MRQVTEDEFYRHINPLDVTVGGGDNPYTTLYKMRHTRKLVGKVIDSRNSSQRANGEGHTYFIEAN